MDKTLRFGDKPYYSFDYYCKQRFGTKMYKLSLDAGMTCPNRDGLIDTRGCIFCSAGGSGDFAVPIRGDVHEAINQAIENISRHKNTGSHYIAYLQSFTGTYGPVETLRKLYLEILSSPKISALSIATRPDCLGSDILELLKECNEIKPVFVELGLQTIHEETARFIRRGYSLPVFEEALSHLNQIGVETIVHVILGLPGESQKDMLATIDYLAGQSIQGIKLQLLHILDHTDLGYAYQQGKLCYTPMTMEEYIHLLITCIEYLPPHIVIHRITGDGAKKDLLAPLWSSNKKMVLNTIHKTMKELGSYQGKLYSTQKERSNVYDL